MLTLDPDLQFGDQTSNSARSGWSMWTLSMFISSPSTLRLNLETEMGREGGADQ